jgi:hypothetical protein
MGEGSRVFMIFRGNELRAILASQTEPVNVRNGYGYIEARYQRPQAALSILRRGDYCGIGHNKRIRFIQPESMEDQVMPWGADLDFSAPKGARAEIVGTNYTQRDAKKWKPRLDKSRTGTAGSMARLRIGPRLCH